MALISVISGVAQGQQAQPSQPAPAAKEKKPKDQGEYDIYNAVLKETDNSKKVALLSTWKEKYPDSDFKQDRLKLFIAAYQQLGQPAKMIDASKEMLAIDPADLTALYWIATLTPTSGSTSPDVLDLGEKAANGLLNAQKPAEVKDEDWQKAKPQTDAVAYTTLGWVGMQRKNYDAAEQNFKKSLDVNPSAAQVSFWLGTTLVNEKKPDKQAQALWHFARAATFDGQGALNPDGRKTVDIYLTKVYTTLHGDTTGLAELKAQAMASPLPPADFHIQTAAEVAAAKEEDLKKTNPQLAMWLGIKGNLLGTDGQTYFDGQMKGTQIPTKLKGWLVAAKPAVKSKELVVNMEGKDANGAAVTLKLVDSDGKPLALTGKPEIGSEIEFTDVVPDSFTKEPLMLSFTVEKSKITGLKMEAVAPPVHHPAVHKKS